MTDNKEKLAIRFKLQEYCELYESQNKAANSLTGVSSATISQILNKNWEHIDESMFRTIAAQIGYSSSDWEVVKTRDFNLVMSLLGEAQKSSQVFAITGEAGSGKTEAVKHYASTYRQTYLLRCSEYWNRKEFMSNLLRKIGTDPSGMKVAEMMQEIVNRLKKQKNPLIIMDEADKLTDQVIYFFITIYNELEDHCGIVLSSTDYFAKRILNGIKSNKKGYKEIYSRLGRKFIELNGVDFTDVTQICVANGIEDKHLIKKVFMDCEGDIRRIKRKIYAIKAQQKNQAENGEN